MILFFSLLNFGLFQSPSWDLVFCCPLKILIQKRATTDFARLKLRPHQILVEKFRKECKQVRHPTNRPSRLDCINNCGEVDYFDLHAIVVTFIVVIVKLYIVTSSARLPPAICLPDIDERLNEIGVTDHKTGEAHKLPGWRLESSSSFKTDCTRLQMKLSFQNILFVSYRSSHHI